MDTQKKPKYVFVSASPYPLAAGAGAAGRTKTGKTAAGVRAGRQLMEDAKIIP